MAEKQSAHTGTSTSSTQTLEARKKASAHAEEPARPHRISGRRPSRSASSPPNGAVPMVTMPHPASTIPVTVVDAPIGPVRYSAT